MPRPLINTIDYAPPPTSLCASALNLDFDKGTRQFAVIERLPSGQLRLLVLVVCKDNGSVTGWFLPARDAAVVWKVPEKECAAWLINPKGISIATAVFLCGGETDPWKQARLIVLKHKERGGSDLNVALTSANERGRSQRRLEGGPFSRAGGGNFFLKRPPAPLVAWACLWPFACSVGHTLEA